MFDFDPSEEQQALIDTAHEHQMRGHLIFDAGPHFV